MIIRGEKKVNYIKKLIQENSISTPCFIIDENVVSELSESIESSLKKYWKKGIIGYSFKTNNFPWLINFFKEKGYFAEVVSSDEYDLALELGYDYEHIIFNGPVKSRCNFEKAIINGSIVNIDSKIELKWLKQVCGKAKNKLRVGLRVNFCLENYCPGESQCGKDDGRFGFSYENGELASAIDLLQRNGIKLSGLHLHCSSKTRSVNIYKAIANVAREIIEKYQLNLSYVDIGGGYFGGLPNKPTFDDYFSAVYDVLKGYDNLNLIIEPGMSVIGAGVDYITTVVDVKTTLNNNFAVLDGSRIHIDPIKRKSSYTYDLICNDNITEDTVEGNVLLCGFTCMEDDRFFTLENYKISTGDNVIFHKVGAYTMGLSPQFIEFYPSVYRKSNDKIELIRKKVTAKDFVLINKGV